MLPSMPSLVFTLAFVSRKPTTFATVERGGKTKLVFALPGTYSAATNFDPQS